MKTTLLSIAALIAATPALAEQHSDMSYCETGFISGDQNQDGMIDEAEAQAARDTVYQSLDANADGSIDREEFVACTTRAEESMTQDASAASDEQSFDAMDANADDMIQPQELFDQSRSAYEDVYVNQTTDMASGWQNPFIYVPESMSEEDMQSMTRDQFDSQAARTFYMTDTDGDGTLSREEWIDRGEQYVVDADRINQRFDAQDANADGQISSEEFDRAGEAAFDEASEAASGDGNDTSNGVPAVYWYIIPL